MPNTSYTPYWPGGYVLRLNRSGLERAYFRMGRNTQQMRKVLSTLIGVVPGTVATLTHKRRTASILEQGGKVPIETFTEISRATTAADVTRLGNVFNKVSKIATPVNKAGSYKI